MNPVISPLGRFGKFLGWVVSDLVGGSFWPIFEASRFSPESIRPKSIVTIKVRANRFSNRVVDNWNSLTEDIVNAPSLNGFKSRLNRFWHRHPNKFSPPATHPGKVPETGESRTRMHQKRPIGLIRCRHRYIKGIYDSDRRADFRFGEYFGQVFSISAS